MDGTKLRTKLKGNGLKAYPAQIYMLATVVNSFLEFRMGMTENEDTKHRRVVWQCNDKYKKRRQV
ncbi:chloramphenicol acetyltransferase [Eubacteriales bacterium OttesenSCG-928-A19]|nr:chloramphenicol acetyltransferase [Eubacteriales bacterium OttesenSCG-928-A19]